MASPNLFRALDFIALTKSDEGALSKHLLEVWPELRFVQKDYMYTPDGSRYRRKDELDIPYADSLADIERDWTLAWWQPEDWVPRWEIRRPIAHDPGDDVSWPEYYVIANHPMPEINYLTGYPYMTSPHPTFLEGAANPTAKKLKIESFRAGRLYVRYERSNPGQKRLADKVVRIAKKLCSNAVVPMDPVRRLYLHPPRKGEQIWVGPDGMRWMREKSDRYVDGNYRPADEYDPARLVPEYEVA